MSNRNDEAFAEFMVRQAKKIVDRHDESDARARAKADEYNSMMTNLVSRGTLPNQYHEVTLYPGDYTALFNPIRSSELEVIKAYFNGEDVLTTILSQER
ncbi:hypothetical protein [Agrobacterium sp. CG674]